MDAPPGPPAAAAKGPPDPALATTTQHGNSQNPSSPAVSPTTSTGLAPLEFLQNQRRGSITDPSLHAAGPSTLSHPSAISSNPFPPSLRPPDLFNPAAQSRPSPAYRFGEATESNILPQIRNLLRSPSVESIESPTDNRPDSQRGPKNPGASGDDRMEVDVQSSPYQSQELETLDRPSAESVGLNGRRASLAGTKRKMSPHKDVPAPGHGDIDPQLVSPNESEPEGPAPKRRSSAFDTRIAHLSLNDRRNSADARASGGQQWWSNETREANPPASGAANPGLANTPTTGYSTPSSGLPGDLPHGRPPAGIATFAWPANPQPDQAHVQPSGQNEASTSMATNSPYDPLVIMSQPQFPPDRRMSAPAVPAESMSTPSAAGPTRSLRSRSRPPSRVRRGEQTPTNNASQSPSTSAANVIPEDVPAELQSQARESGSTPYSRSPELRVSHKLAERKRRKEMKDLFDELRDQLPADRGMKASKWEILSKAIDFIVNLKQSHQDMSREIDMLRHEVESHRQGMPPFPPGAPPPHVYGHPPIGVPPFPPPGPGGPSNTHPGGPPPGPPQQPPQPPLSRPESSQNAYPPGTGPSSVLTPPQNGNTEAASGAARTDAPS